MALDFLQSLFGGSQTNQSASSTPVDFTPGQFANLRPEFANQLSAYLQGQGQGQNYTGPLFSPITGAETNQLSNLNGQTGLGTDRQNLLSDTLQGKYLPGQANANPFVEAAIKAAQRPTYQGLEETLSRALPGRFTQAGQITSPQGSSAFDRAGAIASRAASDTAGDIATNISMGTYEGERNRQQQAVQLDQAEVDTTIKNLQAQALPRLIQELGIERGLNLFQQRTASVLQVLQTLAGVTSPVIANKSQSTGTAESTPGIIPGLTNAFRAAFPAGA